MLRLRLSILLILFFSTLTALAQDLNLYLTDHYLPGVPIIKVNRDFNDEYMWILAQNNQVYRLNTLTKELDDFTAQFQAYNTYQFFDIAAFSQNMVTLAGKGSQGTILISYNNGSFTFPLSQNPFTQIKGAVTSIGVVSSYTWQAYGYGGGIQSLLIATTSDLYMFVFYDQIVDFIGDIPSQVYAATYRNQLFVDQDRLDTTGVKFVPVLTSLMDNSGYYNGLLRTGNPFGDTINTAYPTSNTLPNTTQQYYTPDVFWGNKNGMFQAKVRNSHPFLSAYKQYLNKIQVNKIVDIYGLTAFGVNAAKENLLIGTNNGLYYSSSFLHAGIDTSLDNFTLYHFDALGNIAINFVEVNATATVAPICENGIWLATNDGFYLVSPDFTPGLDTNKLINTIHFSDALTDTTSKHICAGDSIVVQLNYDVAASSIQWFKDGTALANQSKPALTIKQSGSYSALLFDPCSGIHIKSNPLKVTTISGPVFSFNYPAKIQQCNNLPDTLKTDNNPGYRYRWYTNGTLNGDTTSSFIVTQTGTYKVEVSACTNSWVPSTQVEVDFITLPVPQVTADKSVYCAEDTATLSINVPVNNGYSINWYRNGTLLTNDYNLTNIKDTVAGIYTVSLNSNISNCVQTSLPLQVAFTPPPVFTFNYPAVIQYCSGTAVSLNVTGNPGYQYRWYRDGILNGNTSTTQAVTKSGVYKVEVSACAGSWSPSKEVQVNLIQLPAPVIVADKPAYCVGDKATFSTPVTPNASYTINWFKDNVLLANSTNQPSITTNAAGNYSFSVVSNSANTDGSICSVSSAVQNLFFNWPPSVTIEKIVKTTICDGQVVDLLAHYNGGAVKWSTGEVTDQISVTTSGIYKATVTSPAGCQTDTSITITFLSNPVLHVNDTSICSYKRQAITLNAPLGFSQYLWNGETGGQTFQVTQPQIVSLTITDANGCQTTQQIKVIDQCPNIFIPNAFTPNGDGINDTWAIGGLDDDPTVLVRIYNRYGMQVFESRGYGIPWNGEYNGKKLNSGVYYYIVTAKNNTQKFSGAVTIIY